MGVKSFFKKVGKGIGKFGKTVLNGVKKVGAVVGKVAKPVLGVMSHLPGIAGTIGDYGKKGIEAVEKLVEKVPNQKVKDKIMNVMDKGRDLIDKGQNKVTELSNKAQPFIDKGKAINNTMINAVNKAPVIAGAVQQRLKM